MTLRHFHSWALTNDPGLIWSDLNAAFEMHDGSIVYEPARRKVILMGGSLETRALAPLDDPTWDVWTNNNIAPRLPDGSIRADRWFEMHDPTVRTEERWRTMQLVPRPVYTPYPDVARCKTMVRYSLEDILAAGYRDYFANTFAYQIALALYEGVTEIALYGVTQLSGSPRERSVEAACVSYWIGLAEGRGVRVTVPKMAWGILNHPFRYGIDARSERLAVACYTAAMFTRSLARFSDP